MKREKLQVVFWQEAHLSSLEHEKLKKLGFQNTYYFSHKSAHRRGSGYRVLIPNAVNFEFISEVKDKEGRFILVKGKLDNQEVTLLNVYAPPGRKKICGGDFNIQLQPKLDTSNQHQKKSPNAKLIQLMRWSEPHPGKKQFTYYSPCHSVYSRIDYLFMYKSD